MRLSLGEGECASGWNVRVAGCKAGLALKRGVRLVIAASVAEVGAFHGGEL
jgi:hypothetical protein